jgi:hypothetical protein
MSNRTAKFVSALFASVLAGAPLGTLSHDSASAAEECLPAPKGASPEGKHWYYRIDHTTKRHCWYLGQRDKPSQTASRSTRSEKSAAAKTESSARHSVSDARAELPAAATIEPANPDDRPIRAAAADAVTVSENTQAPAAAWPDPPGSVVASRWPEMPGASTATSPPPGVTQLAPNELSNAAAAPPAAVASAASAAVSPRQTQSGSIPMLLAVITGALALAGIIASVVFKFGGIRRLLERSVRARRGSIWDNADENVLQYAHTEEDAALSPRTGFHGGFDRTDEWSDPLPEFLAKVRRRAPT